jgi:hypothetical protein
MMADRSRSGAEPIFADLTAGTTGDAEWYAYSASWLVPTLVADLKVLLFDTTALERMYRRSCSWASMRLSSASAISATVIYRGHVVGSVSMPPRATRRATRKEGAQALR